MCGLEGLYYECLESDVMIVDTRAHTKSTKRNAEIEQGSQNSRQCAGQTDSFEV